MFLDGTLQISSDDPWFGNGNLILFVNFENPVHAGEGEDEAALHGHAATGHSGAGAARHNREPMFGGETHDGADLAG